MDTGIIFLKKKIVSSRADDPDSHKIIRIRRIVKMSFQIFEVIPGTYLFVPSY